MCDIALILGLSGRWHCHHRYMSADMTRSYMCTWLDVCVWHDSDSGKHSRCYWRLGLSGWHGVLAYVCVHWCVCVTWLRIWPNGEYDIVGEGSGCRVVMAHSHMCPWLDVHGWHDSDSGKQRHMVLSGKARAAGWHGSLAYKSVTLFLCVTLFRFREAAADGIVGEGSGCAGIFVLSCSGWFPQVCMNLYRCIHVCVCVNLKYAYVYWGTRVCILRPGWFQQICMILCRCINLSNCVNMMYIIHWYSPIRMHALALLIFFSQVHCVYLYIATTHHNILQHTAIR